MVRGSRAHEVRVPVILLHVLCSVHGHVRRDLLAAVTQGLEDELRHVLARDGDGTHSAANGVAVGHRHDAGDAVTRLHGDT